MVFFFDCDNTLLDNDRFRAELDAQLEREAVVQRGLADGEDFREGLAAFRQKRAPAFRGK